jgi:hypothetical protein
MSETALTVQQGTAQQGGLMEYSPQQVAKQIALVQEVMRTCMKDGEHYGKIPGCGDKPTLLKSGAEKLNFTFRMAPDYEVDTIELANGHREYRVKCKMTHISTGLFLGAGVGSATTLETKWRYRNENTGKSVPKEYWDSGRNPAELGGEGFTPRKITVNGKSEWVIFHQVEHPNPADYYNTCLKMAKKRALVDAVLTCTAASDIFTQDVEELRENGVIDAEEVPKTPAKTPIKEPQSGPQNAPPPPPPPKDKGTPPPANPRPTTTPKTGGSGLKDNEALVTLGKVGAKDGTNRNTGKTWIRTFAKGSDGNWYSTFDAKLGDAMRSVEGSEVIIEFVQKDSGRDVTNIRMPDDAAQDTTGNTDAENRETAEDLPFTV